MRFRAVLSAALPSFAVLGALGFAAPPSPNSPAADCKNLRRHGKLNEARACFTAAAQSTDPFTRAEGLWGLNRSQDANDAFRQALRQSPNSAPIRAEWGRFFLDHTKTSEAGPLFQEAMQADPNYAPAYLGLARVMAEHYDKQAVALAHAAIDKDPNYVEAHEFLAYLALEDDDRKQAAAEARDALSLSNEALDGMAVLAAIDALTNIAKNDGTNSWTQRILQISPTYGEAYETVGHFFEINRRYEEAIASYRKALALNDGLASARSQLGVNLMRLGYDAEARDQLEHAYRDGFRNAETVNALRLYDISNQFDTFRTPTTELRLSKKESTLLRPYIEPELKRAIAAYETKYKMRLSGPVRLDVFPNHDDFAVRVLGLPGQGGLLGVTFGLVVAMDSPSARPPGDFTWASTMWHELSHVYVVTATHGLVPRWFTEGLAVHEEGAATPEWTDHPSPTILAAIKDKKLLPILKLDSGFVRPQYPAQVIVSYFQAGKMLDFISSKWGDATILGMIHCYADGKSTEDAITQNLHESPDSFDREFTAWLDHQTGESTKHFDEWKHGLEAAYADEKKGNHDQALKEALAIQPYYPDYTGANSGYELLAQIYFDKGNKSAATEALEHYRDLGGRDPSTLKKLALTEKETGNTKQAVATLKQLNYIYPEDEAAHRELGGLLLDAGDVSGAVREYQAVLALQPTDVAQSHYELARAFRAAKRLQEAKDQVLLALESAPDFKPAQQLLLQLNQ